MITQRSEAINQHLWKKLRYMTTIIGINCVDGIVLASDSQATSELVKDVEVSKIFKINDSVGIGAAGNAGHIKDLVEALRQDFGDSKFDSDPQLRQRIDDVLLSLHRKYNVERSSRLGYEATQYFFAPQAILGARLQNDSYGLYHLTLEPWVYPVDNYQTIGSGFALANLVLKQQSRAPSFDRRNLADLGVEYNTWIASYAINEVKAIEPYTGGRTKVVLIDKAGYREIPDDTVMRLYNEIVNAVSTNVGERLSDDENVREMMRSVFPSS